MKLILRAILILAVAGGVWGCAEPGPSLQTEPGNAGKPIAENPSVPNNSPEGPGPKKPEGLKDALAALPPPSVAPFLRWPAVKGEYHPLPSGLLLQWTSPYDNLPFVIRAVRPSGAEVWSRPLKVQSREVWGVKAPPGSDRVAIVMRNGSSILLDSGTGSELGTFQVDLQDVVSMPTFSAGGRLMAVHRKTPSAAIPVVMEVYPPGASAKPLYGASGTDVYVSPYHDLVVSFKDGRLELTKPDRQPVSTPYPVRAQAGMVQVRTSADGQRVYILSRAKGLDVYDRDLNLLFHLDVPEPKELSSSLALVGKQFWMEGANGRLEVVDAAGKKASYPYSPDTSFLKGVLPGGEAIVAVQSGGRQLQCVVKPNGAVFGCFPFVAYSDVVSEGRSFFWTVLDDGAISVFKVD